MQLTTNKLLLRLPVLCGALLLARCVSPESPLLEAGGECEGFSPGQSAGNGVEIDATVHLFMEASSDFTKVARELGGQVKTACANIAADLGATDTWSALGDADAAILNSDGTGACNAAGEKIRAIMEAEGATASSFALVVTRGACHVDFAAQQQCDDRCDVNQACEPGSIEERCDPGRLSVICESNCRAEAVCEGTAVNACNCSGRCESTCHGQCDGACIAADGTITMNDPNCLGKCEASCHGTCEGICEIEAEEGVHCGTNVRCRGGCTSSYTDPVCEDVITPPDCSENAACHESCAARAAANPICDPTRAELFASADASPALQELIATINRNLAPLIEAAEAKGPIMVNAVRKLAITGEAVVDKAGDLSGKSLSCAKAASKAATDAAATLELSADASAMVTATAHANSGVEE